MIVDPLREHRLDRLIRALTYQPMTLHQHGGRREPALGRDLTLRSARDYKEILAQIARIYGAGSLMS